MLLGEAPGETEIHNGIPFSGRAGKQLMVFRTYSRYKGRSIYYERCSSRPYKWREKRTKWFYYTKSIIERQIKEK